MTRFLHDDIFEVTFFALHLSQRKCIQGIVVHYLSRFPFQLNYEQFSHTDKNIFLVDMRREKCFPMCELAEKGIEKFLREGKKIGILTHRRWYSSGKICHSCWHIPLCTHCDIAIAYHQGVDKQYFGLCHICKRQYAVQNTCDACHSSDIDRYGIGGQQLQELIEQRRGVTPCVIESDKVNSPAKITALQQRLSASQLIIGTSLLVQPIKDIVFDLIIVAQADVGLHFPDYSANRNNFLLLYSLFTAHATPTFIVQTYTADHYVIRHACQLDEQWFREQELRKRKQWNYPPFTQLCVLLYKHEIEGRLYTSVHKLYQELLFLKETYGREDLELYATPPTIYKVYGKFRYNIILKGSDLRAFMDIAYSKLQMHSRGFKIDWQPMQVV